MSAMCGFVCAFAGLMAAVTAAASDAAILEIAKVKHNPDACIEKQCLNRRQPIYVKPIRH
jgi:hypothetical protein